MSIQHYQEQFEQAQLPGDQAARQAALARFIKAGGLPTKKLEDWRYTDLSSLNRTTFNAQAQDYECDLNGIDPWVIQDAHTLIFINGEFEASLSDIDLPKDVSFLRSKDAFEQGLISIFDESDSVTALNNAFAQDGMVLNIGDNVLLEQAIQCIFLQTNMAEKAHICVRNHVQLGKNAQASIVLTHLGLDDNAHMSNVLTTLDLGDNSQLSLYRLQAESTHATHLARIESQHANNSRLYINSLDIGGKIARTDSVANLANAGAEAHMNGVYAPLVGQHCDNHTTIRHIAPHCISREDFRGLIGGRAVFNGRIEVKKDAQKTDSEQNNGNLLLNDRAEIDTKPELEIFADDVKCAHGATIGQLDENALFYLQSRGLPPAAARNLLTYSFADEVLDEIALDSFKDLCEHALLNHLPNGQEIKGWL